MYNNAPISNLKGFKWQTQVSNLEVKNKREKFFSPNLPRPQISTVIKQGAGLLVIITDKSTPQKLFDLISTSAKPGSGSADDIRKFTVQVG